MFSSQWKYVFSSRSGRMRVRPSRTAASAGFGSVAASTNHWSVRNGSIATLERSPCGTVWVSASIPSSQPCSSASVTTSSRAS